MKARRRSRLPVGTQKRLLEHFVAGTPARSAAELVGVNRKYGDPVLPQAARNHR